MSTPFAYMSRSNKYSEKANSELQVNGRRIRLKKVDPSRYIYTLEIVKLVKELYYLLIVRHQKSNY